MGKYFTLARAADPYLYIRLLDKDGKLIRDCKAMGCHGGIVYTMEHNTATINVYRKKAMMPYDLPEVKRWIADLNEMGFPCEFKYDENNLSDEDKQDKWAHDTVDAELNKFAVSVIRAGHPAPVDPSQFYNFFVHLKDFANKSHMFSTLQLMRVLYESTLCRIPEIYFEKLDEEPKTDKFQLLQDCHKGKYNGYSHAITFDGNGKNVSHETLMKRFSVKEDLLKAPLAIYKSWNGSE